MAWFDAHASGYDAWYDTGLGRYADRVEKELIERLAGPVPGQRALDLGCGTGQHALWLAGQGLAVTGLDESAPMLELAAAKPEGAGLDVRWLLGDAAALPFDADRFDLVISVAALEFVDDPAQVLAEAMRVLRPGGRLVVGLINSDSTWGDLYRQDAAQPAGSVFARAHLFTEPEIPRLLKAPFTLRRALYHPPVPELDPAAAERREREGQARQDEGAGFIGVRWVKEQS